MAEQFHRNHNIKTTFLSVASLLRKIKKNDRLENSGITIGMIQEHLAEIEKYLPNIREKLPQIALHIQNDMDGSSDSQKITVSNSETTDSNTTNYLRTARDGDRYYKIEENKPEVEKKSEHDSSFFPNHSVPKISSPPESNSCKLHYQGNCTREKTNDIDECIQRIRTKLDRLTEDDDDNCDLKKYDNKTYIEHISKIECREISNEEEKSASKWDLCELRSSKPCKHQCGIFAIDEDLNIFRKKVMQKAEIIISCYKKKLLECERSRKYLQESLRRCQEKHKHIKSKLDRGHYSLRYCENNKKKIMENAKKYEQELQCLIEKYNELENLYQHKKEAEKCQNKNKHLIKELQEITEQMEECLENRQRMKEEVNKLHDLLKNCKKDKYQLIKTINKLQHKLKKYEYENTRLQCAIRELKEEIHKLNKKVALLVLQNKELAKENTDLKKQLEKILETLMCLCNRYNALKNKCNRHKIN